MLSIKEVSDEKIHEQLRQKVWEIMVEEELTFQAAADQIKLAQSTLHQFITQRRKAAANSTIIRIHKWVLKKEKAAKAASGRDQAQL